MFRKLKRQDSRIKINHSSARNETAHKCKHNTLLTIFKTVKIVLTNLN